MTNSHSMICPICDPTTHQSNNQEFVNSVRSLLSAYVGDVAARILKVNLVVFVTLKVTRALQLHLNAYNQSF